MVTAAGTRIGWRDLPQQVVDAVESILGGRVVEAVSQSGGFSPGSADRVRTDSGHRAFVKAVSREQNDVTPDLHRREIQVTAALPAGLPVPDLLGSYDDGEWVALVLQDIPGRHPSTPWRKDELRVVLNTLERVATDSEPMRLTDLPDAGDLLGENFDGIRQLVANQPDDLDPWVVAHLEDLQRYVEHALPALAGDSLVHTDVRADNVLLADDGRVVLVDWPWACRGAGWVDTVLLLINVNLYGGHDVERLLKQSRATDAADPRAITGALAGVAGYFIDQARRPAPPALPTVREFQRAQGEATLRWLRHRLG